MGLIAIFATFSLIDCSKLKRKDGRHYLQKKKKKTPQESNQKQNREKEKLNKDKKKRKKKPRSHRELYTS